MWAILCAHSRHSRNSRQKNLRKNPTNPPLVVQGHADAHGTMPYRVFLRNAIATQKRLEFFREVRRLHGDTLKRTVIVIRKSVVSLRPDASFASTSCS